MWNNTRKRNQGRFREREEELLLQEKLKTRGNHDYEDDEEDLQNNYHYRGKQCETITLSQIKDVLAYPRARRPAKIS